MMIEKEILQILQTAIIDAVANSTNPALPIQALGRQMTPDNSQKYLEIVHIPNNITGENWGNSKTYRGIIRLILHWPNNDQGDYEPLELLKSICSSFNKQTILQNGEIQVKFSENPDFTGALGNGQERLFPVSLVYYSFQIN